MEDHAEQHQKWWQQLKQHRVAIGVVAIVLVVAITLIIAGYWFDWTGFNGYNKITIAHTISGTNAGTVVRTEEYQPGKGLWDWLGLLGILAIPVVVGWLTFWQGRASDASRNQQKAIELYVTTDNQREAALQAYLDRVSELLLQTSLSEEMPNEKVFMLIRARTITTLKRLDPDRKTSLFGFLWEAGLIGRFNLDQADFSGADLSGANLRGVKLRKANLSRANLHGVTLDEAELLYTNLKEANLSRTMMYNADLRGADLTDADLTDAYLTKANIDGAVCCEEQLKKAKSLKGATMPKGDIHP